MNVAKGVREEARAPLRSDRRAHDIDRSARCLQYSMVRCKVYPTPTLNIKGVATNF